MRKFNILKMRNRAMRKYRYRFKPLKIFPPQIDTIEKQIQNGDHPLIYLSREKKLGAYLVSINKLLSIVVYHYETQTIYNYFRKDYSGLKRAVDEYDQIIERYRTKKVSRNHYGDIPIQPKSGLAKHRFRLFIKTGGLCSLCGGRIDSYSEASLDHIVPKSKGGTNKKSNLQLAHKYCNSIKGSKDMNDIDWIEFLDT